MPATRRAAYNRPIRQDRVTNPNRRLKIQPAQMRAGGRARLSDAAVWTSRSLHILSCSTASACGSGGQLTRKWPDRARKTIAVGADPAVPPRSALAVMLFFLQSGSGAPGLTNTPARRPGTGGDAARLRGPVRACTRIRAAARIAGRPRPRQERDRTSQTF